MSDLIVIGYPNEDTAQRVYDELMKLENDLVVDLADAATIRRDRSGKLHVTTPAHHAVAWGSLSGLFWGVLIGLLFLFPLAPLVGVAGGIIGAAMGEAGNLGIKDDFKRRVQDLVQPGTSALLIIVRKVTIGGAARGKHLFDSDRVAIDLKPAGRWRGEFTLPPRRWSQTATIRTLVRLEPLREA